MARLPCPHCDWWVELKYIRADRAAAMLAEHRQGAHPMVKPGAVQSDAAALGEPVPAGAMCQQCPAGKCLLGFRYPCFIGTELSVCRACHKLPCACPQDVIRVEAADRVSAAFDAPTMDELIAAVRDWLAKIDKDPTQGPGQEGNA